MSALAKTTVVALLGLPRTGTTLLARHIGAHSRVAALIEPYQAQRQSGYKQTQLQQLCVDFDIGVPPAGGILIKETATRAINFDLTLQTLGLAAQAGYPTGIILQLRSPIEAFYSKIEAHENYWKYEIPFTDNENSLQRFWNACKRSLEFLQREIYRFPLRVCFFHRFLADPRYELSRLMAFFPLELEAAQFDTEVAKKKLCGSRNPTTSGLSLSYGDPKTWDKSKPLSPKSVANRTGQLDKFRTNLGKHPLGREMLELHNTVTELQGGALFDDDEIAACFFLQFRKFSNSAVKSADQLEKR